MFRILLIALSLLVSPVGSAEVYRCKTPDGKTQVSDTPCGNGSKTMDVRSSAPVGPWQEYQAQNELQRQQNYLAERDAENASIRQQRQLEYQRMEQEEAQSRRQQQESRPHSAEHTIGTALPETTTRTRPQKQPPSPPPVIKSCSGSNCSDQFGNRYTTEAGKTTRQDGKRCYQRGSVMYCD